MFNAYLAVSLLFFIGTGIVRAFHPKHGVPDGGSRTVILILDLFVSFAWPVTFPFGLYIQIRDPE